MKRRPPAGRPPAAPTGTGLRIIGGDWRGRRLAAPAGDATRPLPDRVRQSLFDALGQRCDGWRVLDVCAGSGSFGLEAASRGAAAVELIEAAPAAAAIITANIAACGAAAVCRLHAARFQSVLPQLGPADLIYADPPFPWYAEAPELLAELLTAAVPALAADGRFLIRGERGYELPLLPPGLTETRRDHYGRSWVAWLAAP